MEENNKATEELLIKNAKKITKAIVTYGIDNSLWNCYSERTKGLFRKQAEKKAEDLLRDFNEIVENN